MKDQTREAEWSRAQGRVVPFWRPIEGRWPSDHRHDEGAVELFGSHIG